MADYEMKRHDLDPVVRGTITKKVNGVATAVDLTGYTLPRFHMKLSSEKDDDAAALKVDATAVIEDAVNGIVRYDWVAGDTDTAGNYVAEFELTSPTSRKRTFPASKNKRFITIQILGDLDNG